MAIKDSYRCIIKHFMEETMHPSNPNGRMYSKLNNKWYLFTVTRGSKVTLDNIANIPAQK